MPLLEQRLADGTLYEYEIATQALHTEAPRTFPIVYVAKNPEGLDKVDTAVRAIGKTNPLTRGILRFYDPGQRTPRRTGSHERNL